MSARYLLRGKRHCHQGSVLLEGLLAIFIFSVGLLSILMLLSTALIEVGNARYRSEASLLATTLLAEMWTGDRTLTALRAAYGSSDTAEFRAWHQQVAARLPGVTNSTNQPVIAIDNERRVTITLFWRTPSEATAHTFLTSAIITD
jgi:type IV pilus assembly protein PilV